MSREKTGDGRTAADGCRLVWCSRSSLAKGGRWISLPAKAQPASIPAVSRGVATPGGVERHAQLPRDFGYTTLGADPRRGQSASRRSLVGGLADAGALWRASTERRRTTARPFAGAGRCASALGAPLPTRKLRCEGWTEHHNRIERVYRQDGLAVRKRRRTKLRRPRAPHAPAAAPNFACCRRIVHRRETRSATRRLSHAR